MEPWPPARRRVPPDTTTRRGLAPTAANDVFAIIEALRGRGLTVVIAEQDVRRTLALADRGYVIENGHVVLSGTGEALIGDERVREAYLGL